MRTKVYFTRRNLKNMISNLKYFYHNGKEPSLIEVTGSNITKSALYGGFGFYIAGKSFGPFSYGLSILGEYIEKRDRAKANRYIELYEDWLELMEKGNFRLMRAGLTHYKELNYGVMYANRYPKLEALQSSNGSWIEMY